MNSPANSEDYIKVRSYPERIISIIPLPSWLAWVIFWQLLFLIDYLITLTVHDNSAHHDIFACVNIFKTFR